MQEAAERETHLQKLIICYVEGNVTGGQVITAGQNRLEMSVEAEMSPNEGISLSPDE